MATLEEGINQSYISYPVKNLWLYNRATYWFIFKANISENLSKMLKTEKNDWK